MANKINSFLIGNHYKAPLSKTIEKEYNGLLKTLLLVPANQRATKAMDGTGGKVSITDIIAYQIGWGTLLIGWYETGLKNKMPEMPGDGFSTWDYTRLAQHFPQKYHYNTFEEQLKKFHAIVAQILEIVEQEYQSGNLDRVGVWSWCTLPSGKQWPLSKWITVNSAAPYKRATRLIKTFLKTV